MKAVILLALIIGAVLARPGSYLIEDDKQADPKDTSSGKQKHDDPKPPTPDHKEEKVGSFWPANLDVKFTSLGGLNNNPAVASGIFGELFHKLSFIFDSQEIYIDHKLDEFSSSDGGTLGVGWNGPVPKVGGMSFRAAQSFNPAANGSFDWRIDVDSNNF